MSPLRDNPAFHCSVNPTGLKSYFDVNDVIEQQGNEDDRGLKREQAGKKNRHHQRQEIAETVRLVANDRVGALTKFSR